MINVSLYSVPAPGQAIKGDDRFIGTVRTHMHKAPLTALVAGLGARLARREIEARLRIVDMQTLGSEREQYGELDFDGLPLEKFRVGCSFDRVAAIVEEDHIVGINANFTHSRRIATDFARWAKQRNPRALVVFGGTDATQDPAYYLRHGADVVVKGEAESVFEELIASIASGGTLAAIPSISYRRPDGGTAENANLFLKNPFDVRAMPAPDLDAIDLATCSDTGEGRPPLGVRGPFISIETSRGCAQACTFCATPSTKGRYRFMPPAQAHDHFRYFRAKGVRTLLFQEDNVLSRVHRKPNGDYAYPEGRAELLEMFAMAREMGFCWEFTNGIEFGQLIHRGALDEELIAALFWHDYAGESARGCYRATIPLENLTDDSSRLFRKLKPIEEGKLAIRAIAATGVDTLCFNVILGRPQDDEHVLKLTYDRCLEVKDLASAARPGINSYFNVYNLSLLPGTIDFRKLSHLLAFDLDRDPEVITFYLACLRTEFFTPLEITQARGAMASLLNGSRLIDEFDENTFISHPRFTGLFQGRG